MTHLKKYKLHSLGVDLDDLFKASIALKMQSTYLLYKTSFINEANVELIFFILQHKNHAIHISNYYGLLSNLLTLPGLHKPNICIFILNFLADYST